MMARKRQFRREIKLSAVKRVEQGDSIRAVAVELKIPEELLGEWVANNVSSFVKRPHLEDGKTSSVK